jgi:hypothetical protein
MMRRELLLLAALADGEFDPVVELAGARLVLNGTARRLWSFLRIEVYRAALLPPRPTAARS